MFFFFSLQTKKRKLGQKAVGIDIECLMVEHEPDGRRWAPDWQRVIGERCRVQELRAFAGPKRAATPSFHLRRATNSSAPHYRAAVADGAAAEYGTSRQSS